MSLGGLNKRISALNSHQKSEEIGTFGKNSERTHTDDGDLAIENERLKTTLFLLN